jgi:hypothetical protein
VWGGCGGGGGGGGGGVKRNCSYPAVMQMLEDGLADSCVDCAMRHSLFGTIYLCSRMGEECARTPRHEIIAITITTHSSSRVYYDCRLVSLHTVVS